MYSPQAHYKFLDLRYFLCVIIKKMPKQGILTPRMKKLREREITKIKTGNFTTSATITLYLSKIV